VREFQGLRATIMTNNKRRQAALTNQVIRNLRRIAWFSLTRHFAMTMLNGRGNTQKGKIRHGIARATENLRGMRLPLVSGSDPRECVLQRV
jgi:hypothetical protein